MTRPAISGANHLADDYEALRDGALEGERSKSHFGLVILLREGLPAWMANAHARPNTTARATSSNRLVAAPLVSDDVRADMVVVLASMLMPASEERAT